jgi:photosystem II stability/assembly factor-like uncharacterized protein
MMNCARGQWTIQASHTAADLCSVHSVGHGVAWASGTNGAVLRTTDEGRVWLRCDTFTGAEGVDFWAAQAFDDNTAIIMASGPWRPIAPL